MSSGLGVSRGAGGDRFSVHARARRGVTLELFALGGSSPIASAALERDESAPEPWSIWRAEVPNLPESFEYLFRVDGGPPLVDPRATLLAGGETWGRSDDLRGAGVGRRYRGLVVGEPSRGPRAARPLLAPRDRVIYELHVRGFTRHPSSGVARPGRYAGVVEKLPYLRELGVTTLELLPVFEFDETENPRRHPASGERLLNYWGYSPVSFFAPKAGYAAQAVPGAAARELRELVDECHRAGFEVILDVVYNHTAEGGGGADDPLIGWRGLDAAAYYLLDGEGRCLDFTGCGNTFHANHPVGGELILASLHHWIETYDVDGFRFDLAAALLRGGGGERLERSPVLERIAADPRLADRLLIAEPWDAHGFTPAGGFPEPFLEWDGEARDALRRFVGGLEHDPRPWARRLAGSGPHGGRLPAERSVRFVTCHDGRPLADVVAYAVKHNEGNGEGNRDGWDGEVAWNGGVEGPIDDPELAARRADEVELLLALLALAPGTLQLTAGDELGRTQGGNTNAWCQDNEVGWVNWEGPGSGVGTDRRQLVRGLLALRARLGAARPGPTARGEPWSAPAKLAGEKATLGGAFVLIRSGAESAPSWFVAVNANATARRFPVPRPPAGLRWRLRLDTGAAAGAELALDDDAPWLAEATSELAVAPRTLRLLVAEE